MPKLIKYVDFGINNAKSFFELIALPNVRMYEMAPTIQFGLNAAWTLWHLHEWHWHDNRRNENTRNSPVYGAFCQRLFEDCPELAYLRDISDAAKHCGTGRDSLSVKGLSELAGRGGAGGWGMPSGGYGVGGIGYGSSAPECRVVFDDDSALWLRDIIQAAKDYWVWTLRPNQT
jgi:hypothetical protein